MIGLEPNAFGRSLIRTLPAVAAAGSALTVLLLVVAMVRA